ATDQTHRIVIEHRRPVVVVLNTHALGSTDSIEACWREGKTALAATDSLRKEANGAALHLNEVHGPRNPSLVVPA
ncbi:MAG: hypothetical protein JWN04_4045, partial [Myxococcaceae bacterium]|nr:hypothetical protein [Myxococcaceae bacterium]